MTVAEINEALLYPPDQMGECDRCHDEIVHLWLDWDTVERGDYAYCESCWQRFAKGGAR